MGEFHAIGRSDGIVVMWDKRVWKGELVTKQTKWQPASLKALIRHSPGFFQLCASCDPIIRRELWQEFINVKEECSGPWVACGDFKATRYPNERSEGHIINYKDND